MVQDVSNTALLHKDLMAGQNQRQGISPSGPVKWVLDDGHGEKHLTEMTAAASTKSTKTTISTHR